MRHKLTAIAILLLAGCGSRDNAGNSTANAGAGEATASPAAAAAEVAFSPGEWETTVEVTRMDLTGGPRLPGGMAPPLPPPTTIRSCLTPEQAARPNADFLSGSGTNAGCSYGDFSMAGGRIEGTVNCNNAGTTMRTTMSGQFSADSYETVSQSRITTNGMTIETAGRTRSRRIGECAAGR